MKLRIVSDLHLEFDHAFRLPVCEYDKQSILILAGDIGVAATIDAHRAFFEETVPRFNAVIYVMGNHEHYHGNIDTTEPIIRDAVQGKNVHVLENRTVSIGEYAFIGATLWSDMNGHDSNTMLAAAEQMNDYYCIQGAGGKLTPDITSEKHNHSRRFIDSALQSPKAVAGRVVVTHHAPSPRSIAEPIANFHLNAAYVSDLEDLLINHQPLCWVHGHTHDSADYRLGVSRVICNPRGYAPDALNPAFDPSLCIDIE